MEPDLVRLHLEHVLANAHAPWYLRGRRRVAFFVGHRLGMVKLGYLIDYDRDRYRDFNLAGMTSGRSGPERNPSGGQSNA